MSCRICPSRAAHVTDRHHLCGQVDLAVFTILEVEKRAVLTLLGLKNKCEIHWLPNGPPFEYGSYENIHGQRLRVAVFAAGLQGNPTMASLATLVHATLMPRLSVLVGICAGLKSLDGNTKRKAISGLQIGTVVVPRCVIDFSHAIIKNAEELGNTKETPAHKQYEVEGCGRNLKLHLTDADRKRLVNDRNDYMKNNEDTRWTGDLQSFPKPAKVKNDWKRILNNYVLDPGEFVVSDDDLATSNLLLRSEAALQNLHLRYDRVKSADMEAAGFAVASRACAAEWFIIRGVSDLGDTGKSDLFQPYAAASAATFLKYVMGALDINLLRNSQADNINKARLELACRSVTTVLESFATIAQDQMGKKINLEVYWVRDGSREPGAYSNDKAGVVRDGRMKAERAGALNRLEPKRFFPFCPAPGESPRVVAQVGDPESELKDMCYEIPADENISLKWVCAVALFDGPHVRGSKVGVLCCTSTEPLTQEGSAKKELDRDALKISAFVGYVRDVVAMTCMTLDALSLLRRDGALS